MSLRTDARLGNGAQPGAASTSDEAPHALYRAYGVDDLLLYVGITLNPGSRLPTHREQAAWWKRIVRIEIEWHFSRSEAVDAENAAIATEGPVYNKRRPVGSCPPAGIAPQAAPRQQRRSARDLAWLTAERLQEVRNWQTEGAAAPPWLTGLHVHDLESIGWYV